MGFDIGQATENGLTKLFEFLPQLIGFIILIVIGYFVAKVLGAATRKALRAVRFDRMLHRSAAGNYITRIVESPSNFVGKVVYWLIFLFFLSMAASALQLPLLNEIVAMIYAYIPRIIGAIFIFLIASAIAGGSAVFVQRVMGRTTTARMIQSVVPIVTLSIAAFMILNQLGVATDIVNILFTAIVGAIALGMAIAFGLGGRDVARELLQQAYDAGRANTHQVKQDIARASRNAKSEAKRATNEVQ